MHGTAQQQSDFNVFTATLYTASYQTSSGVCQSVRPSVCLSVTLVRCIGTAKDIIKLFLAR